jgi:hypothetical protein
VSSRGGERDWDFGENAFRQRWKLGGEEGGHDIFLVDRATR